MPISWLKADIFLQKAVPFWKATGILLLEALNYASLRMKRSDSSKRRNPMVAFAPYAQRSAAILPNLVGVFEDDAALSTSWPARFRSYGN